MMLIISMYGYAHLSILSHDLCPDVHLGLGPIVALWAPNGQYDVWCVDDDVDVLGGRWVMFSQLITCLPPLCT